MNFEGALRGSLDRNVLLKTYPECFERHGLAMSHSSESLNLGSHTVVVDSLKAPLEPPIREADIPPAPVL